jgi:hypothetical protein
MEPEVTFTAFTTARHLSISWARSIQSMPPPPKPVCWRSIFTLPSHLCLGLPSLLPSGFPIKTLYAPLASPIRVTRAACLILLDSITRLIFREEHTDHKASHLAIFLFRPKYLPQHPTCELLPLMCFLQIWDTSSRSIQNNRQKTTEWLIIYTAIWVLTMQPTNWLACSLE